MDNNPLYPPRTSQQDYRPPVMGLSSEDNDHPQNHRAISNNQRIRVQQSVAHQSVPVDLHDSRHSSSSQMRLIEQAQNIEMKISKEFNFYTFLLGIDFLVALIGLAFLDIHYYYALQNMSPSLFFVIMVGSYAKVSLNTLSQRYTFIAYIIIAILNFWAIVTVLSINYYNSRDREWQLYLCYLTVLFVLHLIIAFMALKLAAFMQERDILLVPFEPNVDPYVDSEWQQVYALDPQDQQKSFSEKYNKVEMMIEKLIEECSIGLALVHFGVLLGILWIFGAAAVGIQMILFFLSGVGASIYTKVTRNPLGQICFFALYSMTIFWYAFTFYTYLLPAFVQGYSLPAGNYWIVVSLLCSPYIVYNLGRLTEWMQEREVLVAHLRRFHDVLLSERI